ncbi:MAG: glycosyltransferase family 2 protein [Zavarzinella sp.]
MNTPPEVSIIVVNYKTARLVADLLQSIALQVLSEANIHVIVVDNASPDNSWVELQSMQASHKYPWVHLIQAPHNRGFSAGNNVGIRYAQQKFPNTHFFHLLNPDTLVHAGAIRELVQAFEQYPTVGIAGSRMENPDGSFQTGGFRFPGIFSELEEAIRFKWCTRLLARWQIMLPDSAVSTYCDWVCGASMMIRREVIEEIGPFDEDFFLYFEEVDFCHRAADVGWNCCYVPSSRVTHLEGQATGVTGKQATAKRRPKYWFNSRHRYMNRHLPGAACAFANLARLVGLTSWEIRRRIQKKPSHLPERFYQDFMMDIVERI